MCVNPRSQAAQVAGMVRMRSKKFNTLSIGHSAFIWSSLSSRYDPNWSSNVFIQSSPNVCSSSSLVGYILKSAIAVAFTTLVSSKRRSKAVHNASTRTFLSVAKMPLLHVNVQVCLVVAPAEGALDVPNFGNFLRNGPSVLLNRWSVLIAVFMHKDTSAIMDPCFWNFKLTLWRTVRISWRNSAIAIISCDLSSFKNPIAFALPSDFSLEAASFYGIYCSKNLTCFCGWVVSKIHSSTLILTCLWTSKRVLTKALNLEHRLAIMSNKLSWECLLWGCLLLGVSYPGGSTPGGVVSQHALRQCGR